MTKLDSLAPDFSGFLRHFQAALVPTPPEGAPQVHRLLEAQGRVFDEADAFLRGCIGHWQSAVQEGFEAGTRVATSGLSDPAEALRAVTGWQTRTLQQAAQDMQDYVDLWMRSAAYLTCAERPAAEAPLQATAEPRPEPEPAAMPAPAQGGKPVALASSGRSKPEPDPDLPGARAKGRGHATPV